MHKELYSHITLLLYSVSYTTKKMGESYRVAVLGKCRTVIIME